MEGMRPEAIARRFGAIDRFHLLGRTGFVSDDTEQAALVAQSITRAPRDTDACLRALRRALTGWFLWLPWGLGLATLRACVRMCLGLRHPGVRSAGNGASMRAAIVGVAYARDPRRRREVGRALATLTHTDARGVDGALFAAELAAMCCAAPPDADRGDLVARARAVIEEPELGVALDRARELAEQGAGLADAARELGTSGFVVHTIPFATYCFIRLGESPLGAIRGAIAAGGDTDTIAAIVGAWTGTLHGADALPAALVASLHDGPFGPSHLRALARAIAKVSEGEAPERVRFSAIAAFARNVALFPVVFVHGVRVLAG
jgi:ADP-ribosylglycohydrolase